MKLFEIATLNETTEENQILNLVTKSVVEKIKQTVDSKKPGTFKNLLTGAMFSDFEKLTFFGIPLKDLDLPKSQLTYLDDILKKLSIRVVLDSEKRTLANYSRDQNDIYLYLQNIVNDAKKRNISGIKYLQSVLIHELQHAIDQVKSDGKAFNVKNAADINVVGGNEEDYKKYLKLPYETNARFTQALLDIQDDLTAGRNIRTAINKAFINNELTKDMVPDYNRLLSRAYKFFDAHSTAPKQLITNKSFLAKAKAWILGKEEKVIK